MSLKVPTCDCVVTLKVDGCQACPHYEEGVEGHKDPYCKMLKSFLWEMKRDDENDWDGGFPKRCPLPKSPK